MTQWHHTKIYALMPHYISVVKVLLPESLNQYIKISTFLATLQLLMCRNSLLYLLSNDSSAAHPQSSPAVCYLYIPSQTSILLSYTSFSINFFLLSIFIRFLFGPLFIISATHGINFICGAVSNTL